MDGTLIRAIFQNREGHMKEAIKEALSNSAEKGLLPC